MRREQRAGAGHEREHQARFGGAALLHDLQELRHQN